MNCLDSSFVEWASELSTLPSFVLVLARAGLRADGAPIFTVSTKPKPTGAASKKRIAKGHAHPAADAASDHAVEEEEVDVAAPPMVLLYGGIGASLTLAATFQAASAAQRAQVAAEQQAAAAGAGRRARALPALSARRR